MEKKKQYRYQDIELGYYTPEEGEKILKSFKEKAQEECWDLNTLKLMGEKIKRRLSYEADFMTPFEAADYLGVSVNVIYQNLRRHPDFLFPTPKGGKFISFKRQKIYSLKKSNEEIKNNAVLIEEEGVKTGYYLTRDGDIYSFVCNPLFPSLLTYNPNSDGYPQVYLLCRSGYEKEGRKISKRRFAVHRLVAKYFIPNPLNLPCVNHKNGIKTDFSIENLEWCTVKENQLHAFKNGLFTLQGTSKLSGKLGVFYRSKNKKWEVDFYAERGDSTYVVGYFSDLEEAIRAREKEEERVFGFATPRFPPLIQKIKEEPADGSNDNGAV